MIFIEHRRMAIEPPESGVIRFGDFELDLRTGELSQNDTRQVLPQQPFRVLTALTRQPGVLISRVQMSQELWGDDVNVDFEHGLNAVIKRLRETLGDSAVTPRFIETLPRRGYRFIAPVEVVRRPLVHTGTAPGEPAVVSSRGRRTSRLALTTAMLLGIVGLRRGSRRETPEP